MRRPKSVDILPDAFAAARRAASRPQVDPRRSSLDRSFKLSSLSQLGPLMLFCLATTTTCAFLFWLNRELVWAKAMTVPPLIGCIIEYGKRVHLGFSPASILAVALLLHSTGDVIIPLAGIVASMPAFLLGHLFYCFSFARGSDLSLNHLVRFPLWKKFGLGLSWSYAFFMWSLLAPSFEGPLQPVLVAYISALASMVTLAFFSRSRLILLGSVLYMASDSLIALAAFIFKDPNSWVPLADLVLAWPIYVVGQCLITFGVLHVFGHVDLRHPPANRYANALIVLMLLASLVVSLKRVHFELTVE